MCDLIQVIERHQYCHSVELIWNDTKKQHSFFLFRENEDSTTDADTDNNQGSDTEAEGVKIINGIVTTKAGLYRNKPITSIWN
jgi:hypothetical protein